MLLNKNCLCVSSLILISQILYCKTEREIIHPPLGDTRICSVLLTLNGVELYWSHGESCPRNYSHECHGYVGMKLIFECQFDVTGVYNAEAKRVGNSSVNFSTLQLEDAGRYECRTNDGMSYVYNITVSEEEVAIGVDPSYCNIEFSYNATYNCFENKNPIPIISRYIVPRKFYTFGTRNVSVHSEWLTPQYHYPTEIGLQVKMNTDTTEFMLVIQNHPTMINNEASIVLAIISAANNFKSHSICVHLQFQGTNNIFTNLSLPLDADVHDGEEAIFQCAFGTKSLPTEYYFFEFFEDTTNISSVWSNYSDLWGCTNTTNSQKRYQLTCEKDNRPDIILLTYTFRVFNISIKDHGSNFSCTLLVKMVEENIQWKNTATLNVTIATDVSIGNVVYVTVVLPVVLPALVLALAVLLISIIWFRRKITSDLNLISLSPSSKNPNTPSSTNPLSQIQEETITDENQQQPNGSNQVFQMSGISKTNATSELVEHSSLWTQKCIVYVSYTDTKAQWVRNYLKSLIESCDYCEVRLHEDHMIPGFTISGERQRLILEAHKVILVVSKDYSESGWCLYELQHAIQQEPALCHGRIIPIMVDGCQTLPSIVEGVVALQDNDINFKNKLMQNITEHQ